MNAAASKNLALAFLATVAWVAPIPTRADSVAGPAPPAIIVSGTGEIKVPAAHATWTISVITQGASAAVAGADNARVSKAVGDALNAAGLEHTELKSTRLNVSPRWSYGWSRKRKPDGYDATNVFRLESDHLDRVGTYIDAALNAGASEVSEINFSAKDVDAVRRQALTTAVATARADAEAIAAAAGGRLGDVLQLNTGRVSATGGMALEEVVVTSSRGRSPPQVPTDVVVTDITVTATVTGRWGYVPGAAQR